MKTINSGSPGSHDFDVSILDFPYFKFLLLIWAVYALPFLFYWFLSKKSKKNIVTNLALGFGLISLGFVTGAIMGNNRNPISDSIMSSVFTLLGGVVVYMFAQKNTEGNENKSQILLASLSNYENKLLVALVLTLFPLSLLYGSHIGSKFRLQNETYNNNVNYNRQMALDSLAVYKKAREAKVEESKMYFETMYKTWSDNEEKRYEKQLKSLKKNDTIPDVPDYTSDK